jgi:hypothetical protein
VRQQSILRHRQLRRYSRGRGLSRSDPASGCEAASRFMQDGAQDRLSKQFAGILRTISWSMDEICRCVSGHMALAGEPEQLGLTKG